MPTWLIIVLAVLLVLAVGGAIAVRRRLAATEDRGWERSALEASARQAYAAAKDGAEPADLELVQVIDRPGTDDDHAIFRIGDERLTLGRRDGQWVLESLE